MVRNNSTSTLENIQPSRKSNITAAVSIKKLNDTKLHRRTFEVQQKSSLSETGLSMECETGHCVRLVIV